ncbi:hypothetical protein RclHR1_41930001 [Rhizophagus clarus]|uniref:Uncharacterized protein n=1 Tax=Rhizophagus clarus TaxID=94130 RepID=A0A2Z6RFI3_9GLOM|nr:hypothetical protein RclHR1_41930001 [Rhizophagus clarus]
MKCRHVKFPNSATKRLKQCHTPLEKKISLNNSISIVPELIYPISSIQQQLSNIYDGQIWKNLKESSEQGSNNFFRPDKADAHLGLMMNLDWADEVKLHKVNHYHSPIITELESLWEGANLNCTNECLNGKDIRTALIIASCDIPGARKLCGYISALALYHRCEKRPIIAILVAWRI